MTARDPAYLRHSLADFAPGFESTRSFLITPEDLTRFSDVSGDHHPLHRDQEFARQRGFPGVLAHGMVVASRCSAFVARDFVGTHGLLVSMSADFRRPVYCGELLAWRGRVARVAEAGTVEIDWEVTNPSGTIVQCGTACAWLPAR